MAKNERSARSRVLTFLALLIDSGERGQTIEELTKAAYVDLMFNTARCVQQSDDRVTFETNAFKVIIRVDIEEKLEKNLPRDTVIVR